MAFVKASVEIRRQKARAINPGLFDRLIAMAKTSHHGDCWPVQRSKNRDGYGQLRVGGRKQRAHRMMFSLYYPGIEAEVVRHNCNNPACINPAHLRAGTPHDNAIDRVLSGRGGDLRGINNGRSKLTEDQVREIRLSTKSGADIGREFGISKVMACRILRGDAWTHI